MREGDDTSPDDEGMELATFEAVQAEATRALAEIVRDAVRNRPEGEWGWRCGFLSGSRRGARAEGTAADFDHARSQFEAAWRTLWPNYTDADFSDYRRARAWTAWKQTMWEMGRKLPTQIQEGRARCFCGAEIDIASMDRHVTAAHMTETADV